MYRYTGTHSRGRTLSVCLSHTHIHACTCTHTHACTRTHTHTLCTHFPSPPPSPPSDVSFSLLPTRHLVFLPSLGLCLSLLPICPWQPNKEPSKPGVEVKLLTVAIDIRRESKSLQHCVLRYTGAKYRFWGEIPVKIPVWLSVPIPSPIDNIIWLNIWKKHKKIVQLKYVLYNNRAKSFGIP